jgi:hypothetical protein
VGRGKRCASTWRRKESRPTPPAVCRRTIRGHRLFILVGPVHLAWHYAVDGYLSLIATYLIWAAVGRCLPGIPQEELQTQPASSPGRGDAIGLAAEQPKTCPISR